jgi:hypothetical protein
VGRPKPRAPSSRLTGSGTSIPRTRLRTCHAARRQPLDAKPAQPHDTLSDARDLRITRQSYARLLFAACKCLHHCIPASKPRECGCRRTGDQERAPAAPRRAVRCSDGFDRPARANCPDETTTTYTRIQHRRTGLAAATIRSPCDSHAGRFLRPPHAPTGQRLPCHSHHPSTVNAGLLYKCAAPCFSAWAQRGPAPARSAPLPPQGAAHRACPLCREETRKRPGCCLAQAAASAASSPEPAKRNGACQSAGDWMVRTARRAAAGHRQGR